MTKGVLIVESRPASPDDAAAFHRWYEDTHIPEILSVDAIRIYKPRREVYAMAADALRLLPADIAFVSSNRWDVMGATAFGFTCVWVNRANLPDEYPEFPPAKVVRDLGALPALTL